MSTIECQLKLILNSTTLAVTSVIPISDTSSSLSFSKKYSSTRKIHTFLKASTVISKNMSSCSVEVPVYSVPINLNELQHKVYYAEVAVGNTLYVSKEYGMMCEPPSGYDSFLVCTGLNNNEGGQEINSRPGSANQYDEYRVRGRSGESVTLEYLNEGKRKDSLRINSNMNEEEIKRSLRNMDDKFTLTKNVNLKNDDAALSVKNDNHNSDNLSVSSRSSNISSTIITEENINFDTLFYLIKDPSKINILHEVHFNYDQGLENGKGKCEMCRKNPSIMFCLAERASFCKSCDEGIHNNEFTQRHQMFYYDSLKKKKQFLQCPFHMDNISDYFCEECAVLLCSVCKISGSHADYPFSGHKLVRFLEACDKISEKMKSEEKDLGSRIKVLEEDMKIFTSTVSKEFLTNVSEIRTKIENEYRSAMNELNAIIRKKYQIINAKFIEQRVCLERCIRMKKYIEDIDEGQSVKDYKAITEQKNEMISKEVKPHVGNERVIMKGYISIFSENDMEEKRKEIYTENKGRNKQNYK